MQKNGWIITVATAAMAASCGDDTSADSSASSTGATASSSTSAGTAATVGTGTDTAAGTESESAGSGGMTTGTGTTAGTTAGTSTSAGTGMGTDTGVTGTSTSGTSGTTGPTCQDLCMDGVCVGDVCCPVANACGDECCADGQLCAFQTCVDAGDACVTASDCGADSYCDYSLGEKGDQMCNGGLLQTGKCMPLPPDCDPMVEPDDLDKLDCLPTCNFDIENDWAMDLHYEWKDASVMMPPIITHLDDDNCDGKVDARDIPDIVFASFAGSAYNNNGTLHAISIIDGALVKKWSVNPQTDRVWPGKAIAAADLDGIPGAEIVTCTEAGRVRAFKSDGSALWVANAATYCDMPSLADFDGDGKAEVLVSGFLLNGQTGAVLKTFPVKNAAGSWWREHAIPADIDDDGVLEIVTATAAFEADGTLILDTKLNGTYPAIADFDGDGQPEVAALANYGKGTNIHHLHVWRYDPKEPTKFKILHQGIDINGPLSPALCPNTSNGYSSGGGPLTIAEFNGDGRPDVGVAGGVGYAVFDGAKLVDPNVPNAQTIIWAKQTQDCSSSFTGSSVYDFDGDGRAEVVYGDELYMRIYRGFDGSVLSQTCNTSGTLHEYPLIADVDGNGHADIIVSSNNYSAFNCNGVKTTGVRIFSAPRWTRTRKIWNQHAYHVTNVKHVLQNRSARPRTGHCALSDRSNLALACTDFVLNFQARWPSRSPPPASARSSPAAGCTRSRTPGSRASSSASSRAARRSSSSATAPMAGTSASASAPGATPSRSTRPAARRWPSSPATRPRRPRSTWRPRTALPTTISTSLDPRGPAAPVGCGGRCAPARR
ncbi:MAG TPA: hypothetical protein PKW35_08565 [Nannocystaceae bacterium]|nr:hypothetical protein [Nannocystaceae bacterium]